ncbi:MAG: hypothetical protein Q9183_005556 [Haloplaca sp. 2 TL-2023]
MKNTHSTFSPVNPLLSPPNPPRGLNVRVKWDIDEADHRFDPQEVWSGIVELAFYFSARDRDAYLNNVEYFYLHTSGTPIQVAASPPRLISFNTLVWALLSIGQNMVQQTPWAVPVKTFGSSIETDAGELAHCFLRRKRDGVVAPSYLVTNATSTATSRLQRDRGNTALVRPTVDSHAGFMPTPEDARLIIGWRFLGTPLPPGGVLKAFLMANTFLSEHDASSTERVAISARGGNVGPVVVLSAVENGTLTWERARLALQTLWRFLMGFHVPRGRFEEEPRWESLNFRVVYGGEVIGYGKVSGVE